MNKIILIIMIFFIGLAATQAADKYFTRNGHIYFLSKTDIIDIDAHNRQTASFLNTKNGDMVFAVIMKLFKFDLALAEEHFNENYVESEKYPKAKFKGRIDNFDKIDVSKNAVHHVTVSGKLSLHGKTKPLKAKGTIEIKNGMIIAKSKFTLMLKDYGISIPNLVKDKVSKEIIIEIDMVYKPFIK